MNIYISNLHENVSEKQVKSMFNEFGSVSSVNVIMDMETGRSKGFGFVEMDDVNDARQAIKKLNNQNFMGQFLQVEEAQPRTEKENQFLINARNKKNDQNSGKKRQ